MVDLCSLTKRIVYYFQNSFIIFSCLLAAVSASPQYYYRQYQRQVYSPSRGVAPASAVASASTVAAASAVAPVLDAASGRVVVPVAPLTPGGPTTAALTPEITSELKNLAKIGAPHLIKALDTIQQLTTTRLPEALKTLEPSKRADIVKTKEFIGEVCSKIIAEAQPRYSDKYKAEDLQKICDFINKVGTDIVDGLDNSAIFQKYLSQLQTITISLLAKAA